MVGVVMGDEDVMHILEAICFRNESAPFTPETDFWDLKERKHNGKIRCK